MLRDNSKDMSIFSNSYIPTLRVDGNVTLNGNGKTRSLYIGADVDGAQSVATIRLGDQASSKIYVGASIQPMQVFPTALLPSDGAAENIKVIANGHAFRDMDIVYISNSADAAGDAAPLTPSGQRLFYVESASQDAFYLNNSMALVVQHGNVQFAKLNTSKIAHVVGFSGSTIHLKSAHSFDTGDILVVNGTLGRVNGASGGAGSVAISDGVGVDVSGCSSATYTLNEQCILVKVEGFRTTLMDTFGDNGTEPLSMRTGIHDFHSGDILVLNDELYKVDTEPSQKTNVSVIRYPARTATNKMSLSGHTVQRVATKATTIKTIKEAQPLVQFHQSGDYDSHGFSRGDVIALVNVQRTDIFNGKFFVVGNTNRTSLTLNGFDCNGTEGEVDLPCWFLTCLLRYRSKGLP